MAPEETEKATNAVSPDSDGSTAVAGTAECNGIAVASGGGVPKSAPIDDLSSPEIVKDADRAADVAAGGDKIRDPPPDPEGEDPVAAVAGGDRNVVSNGHAPVGVVVEIPVEKGEIDGGSSFAGGELNIEIARESGGDGAGKKPVSSPDEVAVTGGEDEVVEEDVNGGDAEAEKKGERSDDGDGGIGKGDPREETSKLENENPALGDLEEMEKTVALEEEKASISVQGDEVAGSVESCEGASSTAVEERDVDGISHEGFTVESVDSEAPKSGASDDNLEVDVEGGSRNDPSTPLEVDVHVEEGKPSEEECNGEEDDDPPCQDRPPVVGSVECQSSTVNGPSHDERVEVGEVREMGDSGEVCVLEDLKQDNMKAEPEEDGKLENMKAEEQEGEVVAGDVDVENVASDGKEECSGDAVSPEIIEEVSPDGKESNDVPMEIGLEEKNDVVDPDNKVQSEDGGEKPAGKEDAGDEGKHQEGETASNAEEPLGSGSELRFYVIRVPRVQDERLSSEILRAETCLEERTQRRDSIRLRIREMMTSFEEHKKNINDARNEERAAREAFYSKQQEINAVHSTADKIEIANSIDNVDDQVQYLSHRMQHETISLKEEKQLMREIKELKQKRDHLSKLTPDSEMKKAFEQKDQIDDDLKRLRPELEHLRKELLKCESKTKAGRKKYEDECKIVEDLRGQYKVADDLRQEAYVEMKKLRRQLYEKNKHFYRYKDDIRAAVASSLSGDRKALGNHCNDQVERFMELWNKSNEFRNQYVQANQNSTIRRFRTLDGRSLGPNEQPATFPKTTVRRPESITETPSTSDPVAPKRKQDKSTVPPEPAAVLVTSNRSEQGNNLSGTKKFSMSTPKLDTVLAVSNEGSKAEDEEIKKENAADAELKRLADELAREEQLRKEKAAAELKEKTRLEQIAKARDAEERKRRKAEKAKAAAELRARKDAELKEKKRAKKERQKENKAASSTDKGDRTAVSVRSIPDSASEDFEKPETNVVASEAKRSSKAPLSVKQQFKKVNPLPPPLRNRRRRKIQAWIWALLAIAAAILLFLVGGYVSSSRTTSPKFGF